MREPDQRSGWRRRTPDGPGRRSRRAEAAEATSRSPARRSSAAGRSSPIITAMGKRLVAEGCGRYEDGPGPEWTEADRKSYAAWQRKLGFRGKDADGVPGRRAGTG